MPFITKFPDHNSTIDDWRQFIADTSPEIVFNLVRAARRTSGGDDIGFQVLVETAREMVSDAGGGTPTTGLNDAVVAEVADHLDYTNESRTNFRKLVLGIRRQRNRNRTA